MILFYIGDTQNKDRDTFHKKVNVGRLRIKHIVQEVNPMYKKILLPTDGSKYAEKAAEHAIWIADRSCAEIIVITVMETSSLVGLPAEDMIIKIKEMLKEEGKLSLEKISKVLLESKDQGICENEVKMSFVTKEGHPADEILKIIKDENVDLVVMGTSGKHGLDRFLLGSVAEKVVRSSTCPVLVVH